MAMKQEVNVPLILTIGAVSVVLLVVIAVGASAWYLSEDQETRAEEFDQFPYQTAVTLKDTQLTRITAPAHWVDANHTVAAIPIDEAMHLVVTSGGNVPLARPAPVPPLAAPAPAGSK
jgi:sterol desaturase/sphingolipid hydroxylase (fatty acid hydroxylase superfamily)